MSWDSHSTSISFRMSPPHRPVFHAVDPHRFLMPTDPIYQRQFEGHIEQISAIRQFVSQTARDLGDNEDDGFACELSTDEAAANAFNHAYEGQAGKVEVTIWREGDAIVISLRNWGTP